MKLASLKKPSLNKSWIVLAAAVGIGLIASLAAYTYLSNQMAAIESRGHKETVPVVVAKFNLLKGARLSAENVAVRAIPKDYAHSGAVSPEQFGNIEGEALAYPVNGGEMILWGLMEGKKAPTFSARIDPGRRAMTVPVDEINSISGLLEPGDVIDMVASIEQKSKRLVFPLLQQVRVLATGQRAEDDPKTGERRLYSTVTLDTTPQDAQKVIVAREAGKITALLRNPQDLQPVPDTGADIATLLGMRGDSEKPKKERGIPVLYGGRTREFDPGALRLHPATASELAQQADILAATGRAVARRSEVRNATVQASREN